MPFVTTADGVDLFYKDWGPKNAQATMFQHGWPLSSDDWNAQMLFFEANGYRVVAHRFPGTPHVFRQVMLFNAYKL